VFIILINWREMGLDDDEMFIGTTNVFL
jgi:hypothetical protein